MTGQRPTVLLFLCAATMSGCAMKRPHYVQIAEALTAPSLSDGVVVAPRTFTPVDLTAACRGATPVARLVVEPPTLQLVQGSRVPLDTLSIVAVNAADIAIPRQPVVVEAEDAAPPVVEVRSDGEDVNAGRLHAVGEGTFRLRVRTLCGTRSVEKIITGIVGP